MFGNVILVCFLGIANPAGTGPRCDMFFHKSGPFRTIEQCEAIKAKAQPEIQKVIAPHGGILLHNSCVEMLQSKRS